jgi:hypothetical protein
MARLFSILLIVATFAFAQSYRCEWQVVAIGGGEISRSYRAGSTAGQTAIGWLTGNNLLAHIGFWYPDIVTGIAKRRVPLGKCRYQRDQALSACTQPVLLNCEQVTSVVICDIAGRSIRTLVNSTQQPGKYTLHWDGKDNVGRLVPSGVYICRFRAGEYHQNIKLLLQR